MFAIIYVFVLLAAYEWQYAAYSIAAEVPSLFHICSYKDPKHNSCIMDNIKNVKSKICKGLPELNIPSLDPFILDELILSDTSNTKIYIRNAQVTGLCEFNVTYLHTDFEKFHFDIDLVFNQIRVNATYDFDIRLLIPIAYKGQLYITSDNVGAKLGLDMKIVTKGGKRYLYLAKIKMNLDIKGYKARYDLDEKESNQLRDIIRNFLGNNQQEIIKSLKPTIEEQISKRIISIANSILKHFTYEELYSE